jgi:aspartyl aminopeptidase
VTGFRLAMIAVCLMLATAASAKDKEGNCSDNLDCKSSWVSLETAQRKQVFTFGEGYKKFLELARTELSFVTHAVALAEKNGFRRFKENEPVQPGEKYYVVNRDRTLALIVIGNQPMAQGFRVVGAHIDSPRLELKARPLYEKEGFALFQTAVHGGIKPYQWTNIPLALSGRVDRKNGSTLMVDVGMADDDPIFVIADMSPHTDRGYADKKVKDQVTHEELDPIVGHIPGTSGKDVAEEVMNYLAQEYNLSRADLVSAELALTPAYKSRDVGFDRALIAAYGQDDRLGGYAGLMAALGLHSPERTAVVYLVDNEEVGNVNNTGAKSDFFTTMLARLLRSAAEGGYNDLMLRDALAASEMISIDVNPGVNPKNPGGFEISNAPRLGHGVNLKMYGHGFNANSEFTAKIRGLLDAAGIAWQTASYKEGGGRGGTIGGEFTRLNMEVIDFGVPVLSIHTPYSISSKVDVYNLYRASAEFLQQP